MGCDPAARAVRDLSGGKHPPAERGRPNANHALARLALCECGGPMYSYTSPYRRKRDGGRKRAYRCLRKHQGTGTCDAPDVDAELVDAYVVAELPKLMLDFTVLKRRIEDRHGAEREWLARKVRAASSERDEQARKLRKMEAKWGEYVAAGEDAKAELVFPIIEREREALSHADVRLTAASDAHAGIPEKAPADALLDYGLALQDAISGRLDETDSLDDLNMALREIFEAFRLRTVERVELVEDAGGGVSLTTDSERRQVLVEPLLHLGVAKALSRGWPALVGTDEEPPPLRWLAPERDRTAPRRICG